MATGSFASLLHVPIILTTLFALTQCVDSAVVFEVHRLMQFEHLGQSFGSSRTAVNSIATSVKAVGDLSRNILVARISDLTPESLAELTDVGTDSSNRRQAMNGLLILIPNEIEGVASGVLDGWKRLEAYLLSRSFSIPIYFAFENDDLTEIADALEGAVSGESSGRLNMYRFVVESDEASLVKKGKLHNFQGSLRGAQQQGATTPTIAIVSHFDAFGAAPSLASGSNSNASGVAMFLELIRIFRRLYDDTRTQGRYNVLFLLTGGGALNYAGTSHWLNSVDQGVLNSVEFVLCLDSVAGPTDDLFLHVSRPRKTDEIRALYENFENTAKQLDVSFEVLQRKIDLAETKFGFQHELFSRQKFVAATLSSRKSPEERTRSIFDRRHSVSDEVLHRNIEFVAETLARQIYGLQHIQSLETIKGEHAVQPTFVSSWLDYLSDEPRTAAFLDSQHALFGHLEKVIEKSTSDFKHQVAPLTAASDYKFYMTPPSSLSSTPSSSSASSPAAPSHLSLHMTAYTVKPFEFDIVLSLGIVAYLLLVHIAVKQPRNFKQLKALFI